MFGAVAACPSGIATFSLDKLEQIRSLDSKAEFVIAVAIDGSDAAIYENRIAIKVKKDDSVRLK
jgi:hypothetical protein